MTRPDVVPEVGVRVLWHTLDMTDQVGDDVEVRALWPEGLVESAQLVNQFAIATDLTSPDGVYILMGHFAPPIFSSPEHAQQRMEQLGGAVTIMPRGAFYMTRSNAADLRDFLTTHLGAGQNASGDDAGV